MKKNSYMIKIITTIICLLPIFVGIILYNKLPNEIPIHFNVNNIPDNYAPKNIALFVIPVAMTGLHLIIIILIRFMSKKVEKIPKMVNVMYWFTPVLTILLYVIMIIYALGYKISVGRYVCFVIGMLFCILGNYMPKMSYETAKNMMYPKPKNEKLYRKIIRIYGYSFVLIGAILLTTMFFV